MNVSISDIKRFMVQNKPLRLPETEAIDKILIDNSKLLLAYQQESKMKSVKGACLPKHYKYRSFM